MNGILVSDPHNLEADIKQFHTALRGYDFVSGERYAEFRQGDHIAEYGLAALIVGGAAAAAASSGAMKGLGKFLGLGSNCIVCRHRRLLQAIGLAAHPPKDEIRYVVISDQSLWIVCAAFYLSDNVCFHNGRELLLREALRSRWQPLLPLYNYRLCGRAITLSQPWLPFLVTVKLGWLKSDAFSPLALSHTRRLLKFHLRRLAPFRALASTYFVTLFVVGPAATHYAGLAYALCLVIPLHVIGLTLLVALLVVGRRTWRMGWSPLATLVFECAVCPGYSANICRRLSLGFVKVPGDAIAFVLDSHDRDTGAAIGSALGFLVEDLALQDQLLPTDQPNIVAYEARLATSAGHA